MDISDRDPSDVIDSFDDPDIRAGMRDLDDLIRDAMPDRCRVLWEGTFWGGSHQRIIGYGSILQPRPRGDDVEWFLVGLARQKRNFSLYVNAVDNGSYIGQAYADRLGKVKLGAASIGFRSPADLDLGALSDMLHRADEITPPDPPTAD